MELLTLTALKEDYHLSPKWIKRLGPPDEEKLNPHHRSGPKMKLWEKERVEEFLKQHDEEYQKHLLRWEKQSSKAKGVAAKRARETLEYARSVEIHLDRFPEYLEKACQRHLADLSFAREWDNIPEVTDRTIVNMLRHRYSNYHELLDSLYHQIGRWAAYSIIKDRVNQAVCEKAGIPLTEEISRDSDDKFLEKRWA